MASDIDIREEKEKILQAQEKLQKLMKDSGELHMSWWKTFTDVSLFGFKEIKREEDGRMVEERSLLQSGVPAAQDYSAGGSVETLKLLQNEVG